ncbi:MAG: hypothetical protein CVU73_11830 [Deltaproteobacteria bacterium HGW-Deltaproteobacteria-8]|jgi:uncharacterized protein (TIGR00106 family)|nr:MAG: hypothetical protein CVU73_11830 [Deltaproteobacteria bacterium HGW-Deltaproteobacteria-8]
MSVIVELSLFPLDKGLSVSAYVARAVGIIRASGVSCQLTPMGTCIEGEWDEVMAVTGQCFQALAADSDRVYLTLKADWRRGRVDGLRAKTESVERALTKAGEEL